MGKIEGVRIQNFGPLRDIVMGKTLSNQKNAALNNVTVIIGPSGNGKSTLADAFGFLADCLELGVEAACDAKNRGGLMQIRSQGIADPVKLNYIIGKVVKLVLLLMNWKLMRILWDVLM